MDYIMDAHALLWHLYWPQRLGGAAQRVFADADAGQARIHVPAVVVAEAVMVVQKGRLPGASLEHLTRRAPLCQRLSLPSHIHPPVRTHHLSGKEACLFGNKVSAGSSDVVWYASTTHR